MSDREIVLNMGTDSISHEVGEHYKWVKKDDSSQIKSFYQNKPYEFLIQPINPSRDTIFHIAASMGSEQSLQVLFDDVVADDRKRDVLKKTNIYGNTFVHELAAASKAEIPKEEKKRSNGKTTVADNALKFLTNNATRIPEILGMRNHMGETPLYRAAAYGNKKIVERMVRLIGDVDNLCEHYRRSSDDLPILHVAVINEAFDVALWLLEKCPEMAKFRDGEGKTCLHLLATMPTAFESSSKIKAWMRTVYSLIPNALISKDIADQGVQNDSSSYLKPNDTTNSKPVYKRCFSKFCDCLKEWGCISRIRDLKRKHYLAVALVNVLVKNDGDFSWFESHKTNENEMVCFSKYDGEAAEEDEKEEKRKKYKGGAPMASDTPLITAAWSGIMEIVEAILKEYPQAIEHVTKKGQNILHVAVLNRRVNIIDFIIRNHPLNSRQLALGIDNDGDTVLHKVGYITYYTGGTKTTAALKFQEELKWFHGVKNLCPVHYTIHRNNNKFTAGELFTEQHRDLLKEAQEWVKNACQSCSTVAILVVTVLYTVAFQVPGGYNGGPKTKNGHEGHPVLEKEPLYSFFLVMDVSGLAMSLTSVAVFLSILTSSLDEESFLSTIPPKLTLGIVFLFFSFVTTMFSFLATVLLTVTLKRRGTMLLNFVAALTPITIYMAMQYDLYYEYISSFYFGIIYWAKKYLPKISMVCRIS